MASPEVRREPAVEISLAPEITGIDICAGADPFIFRRDGNWHLLLQGNLDPSPTAHRGIKGYTVRTSPTIAQLPFADPVALKTSQDNDLTQSWAGEIDGRFLYVAQSQDGNNDTHRIRVYETEEGIKGPWADLGQIHAPQDDDSWAIDMTFVDIPGSQGTKSYAVWSGWSKPTDQFPQHIYIAERQTPTELGPRRLIATPTMPWCCSVQPILEGPQGLTVDGEFRGLTVAANASWTNEYSTGVIKYTGGNPLETSSWEMAAEPLLPTGKGIGHGMVVEEEGRMFYVGHRKKSHNGGWADRQVFYTEIDKQRLAELLH